MDAERAARYSDKLEHAQHRLGRFQDWAPDAASDLKTRLAAYKAFQEAAKALFDVAAMVLKDLGQAPKDDYANLSRLEENGVLTKGATAALREANGLRNRLLHEYGGLADEIALQSGIRLAVTLVGAVEEVRTWISKRI